MEAGLGAGTGRTFYPAVVPLTLPATDGIEPVPDERRVLGFLDQGALWANLGVSLVGEPQDVRKGRDDPLTNGHYLGDGERDRAGTRE